MLERWFKLSELGTNPRHEVIAGLTSFAAMAYILAVNPDILSAGTGMDKAGLITVTALAAALGCFLMAALCNYPVGLAPGMGLNAYLAFIVIGQKQVPWDAALAMVFYNGIVFFLLSVTGIRGRLIKALPPNLLVGIQCGIGFFIAFIGLQSCGIVAKNDATFVSFGDFGNPNAVIALLGTVVAVILVIRRVPGAIILTILVITLIGLMIPFQGGTITPAPEGVFSLPNSPEQTFFAVDLLWPFQNWHIALPIIFTLLLIDLFDTLGTLVGLGRQAGMMDEKGNMPRLNRALTADAVATTGGALMGTSTVTAYVESATGIQAGGRSGLTALVIGVCFLLALFISPLIEVVPAAATAPALIMVGLFMAQGLKDIDFADLAVATPAILTALLIPFTFSITHGIALGLVVFVLVALGTGKARQVPLATYVIAGLFVVLFMIEAGYTQ